MATLSQLYNAYLQDDPNVGEMTYDPFGWNIEQTFADQDDDTGGGGGGGGTSREDYGDTFGVDPAKLRLPSSFQPTNIGFGGDEGTVGLPGHITQRGPGRGLETKWDDPLAPASLMDKEDDSSWFKQLREGFSPLMQGVMSVASPFTAAARAFGKALPVNETSILQNEMLGQGFALDDLGRIVNVSHGKRDDGTYGFIDYVTPQNVMAGYRPTSVETFDKRIAKINAGKATDETKKRYIDAIKGAKKLWLTANEKKKIRVNQLKREKGIKVDEPVTGVDDGLKKRNYLDIFEEEDKPIPHIFSTAPGTLLEDEYDEGDVVSPWLVPPTDAVTEEDFAIEMLNRAKKEKLAIASMDDAGIGVTHPEGPTLSNLLTQTPLEQMIDAESKVMDLPDPGKRDVPSVQVVGGMLPGGQHESSGGYTAPDRGTGYRGHHWAQGGRVRYSKGGIVDLL